MTKRRVLFALVASLIVGMAVVSGCLPTTRTPAPSPTPTGRVEPTLPPEAPEEFQIVWQTWQSLRQDFVSRDQLDPKKLSEGAVRGMIQALDDPYASFLDPSQYAQEQEDLRGSFEGIGAEVTMRDNQVVVVAPIPDTPAERAGIRPGDVIISVDGESMDGKTVQEVVRRIRGTRGTVVSIGIRHLGAADPVTITVVRDEIRIVSVRYVYYADGTANVRITSFGQNTDKELGEAIAQMKKDKPRGILLDLRNNPGGLLDSVVNVASRFLKDGLVLYEVDGRGDRTDWKVRRTERVPEAPVVVLVNGFSASASEVLAGALRDHGRATLVGEKTFGKGSVNTFRELSDGSGIYFSIARWYTPSGELIEGVGIQPDVEVKQGEGSASDDQLDKALDVLKEKMGG
ncbi:MAG: S41 family peptidase [Chloroflexota bacterium]|nr:S41 family peptidase [Chloroflexota bacterium]